VTSREPLLFVAFAQKNHVHPVNLVNHVKLTSRARLATPFLQDLQDLQDEHDASYNGVKFLKEVERKP
jgi:hypothetical protein